MTNATEIRLKRMSTLLVGHRPHDDEETRHLARCISLMSLGADAFRRETFDPGHFTASAFVLHPDRSKFLLIHHGRLRRWLQPGGHVDDSDDSLEASAVREVREETSVDVDEAFGVRLLDVDVHEIPANTKRNEPRHEHFDVRFLVRARSETFAAGSDALDAKWVLLSEVSVEETDRSVMRAVAKIAAVLKLQRC